MAEYIEREALIKRLEASPLITNYLIMRGSQSIVINGILDLIKKQPAADVAEVRYGYWKDNTNGTFTCTACGCRASKMNFCGHCGAKMDGKDGE